MYDFQEFRKIKNIDNLFMNITQKIHGTNAQVLIYEENGNIKLKTGCRTRWITPKADNFGFAKSVYGNKADFIENLGIGRHFGEWAGPGINSGEGLKEKTLFLFNVLRWNDKPLPFNVSTVPQLYSRIAYMSFFQEPPRVKFWYEHHYCRQPIL